MNARLPRRRAPGPADGMGSSGARRLDARAKAGVHERERQRLVKELGRLADP